MTDQYLRDVGTAEQPCWVPCIKGDPGAVFFTDELPDDVYDALVLAMFDLLEARDLFKEYGHKGAADSMTCGLKKIVALVEKYA
jgi:xylose isomerase